jgi:hypothetical protein
MTTATIHQVTIRLALTHDIPSRLAAAHCGLEVIENALRELTFLDTHEVFRRCGPAQHHAVQARAALARAPSLPWPLTGPAPFVALAEAEHGQVTALLLELADDLMPALVDTAEAAPQDADWEACMLASVPACRMQEHLHHVLPLTTEP